MSTLTILMVISVCSLLTMTFTTPGGVLIGFKLPFATFVGMVGVSLTIITSESFNAYFGIQVIHDRVVNIQAGWLTLAWLIILTPHNKVVKARIKELAVERRRK